LGDTGILIGLQPVKKAHTIKCRKKMFFSKPFLCVLILQKKYWCLNLWNFTCL